MFYGVVQSRDKSTTVMAVLDLSFPIMELDIFITGAGGKVFIMNMGNDWFRLGSKSPYHGLLMCIGSALSDY